MKIMSRAKANPNPMIMPYPNPWDRGAVKVVSPAAIFDVNHWQKVSRYEISIERPRARR